MRRIDLTTHRLWNHSTRRVIDMSGAPTREAGPLHEQIARHIRTQIEAGQLRDREALPSTRDLADQWGVSVFTVNQAMQTLTKEGIVTSKSRSGRVVSYSPERLDQASSIATPQLVLVGGYAGSGKSEFGRILSTATRWPILDKDSATRPMVELALETLGLPTYDRESPTYLEKIRPREYAGLMEAAKDISDCGISVIVTAPFLQEFADENWIDRTKARFEKVGVTVRLVWINSDAETMAYYLQLRGAARDSTKMSDWDAYLAGIDLHFRPAADHFAVHNALSDPTLRPQSESLIESIIDAQ